MMEVVATVPDAHTARADPLEGAPPPPPARRVRRRVVAVAVVLTVGILAAEVTASVLGLIAAGRGGPPLTSPVDVATTLIVLSILCGLALVVALRVPANPIGWMFFALAAVVAVPDLVRGHAALTLLTGGGDSPLALALLAPAEQSWILAYAVLTALALVFPDGRLVSRRWRPIARGTAVVFTVGYAVGVARLTVYREPFSRVADNPWQFAPLLTPAGQAVSATLWLAMLAVLLVGAATVATRLRRSSGIARQQVKWFAYAAVTAPLLLAACGVIDALGLPFLLVDIGGSIVLVSVPAAATVAILRYRLYDIDRLINQTIVYAVLTVLIAGSFAGIVVLGATVAGRDSPWAVAVATLLATVTVRPLRDRVQRVVDRRFSRQRYDALRIIEAHVRAPAVRRARQDVRDVLARALDDPQLRVVYRAIDGPEWLDADGRQVDGATESTTRAVTVVRRGDEPVAALVHSRHLLQQRHLLDSVARAALLPLDNARLRAEVQRQLTEVRSSRARIVAAGYAERKRVERDLHDGAQQRLVALGVHLRVAQEQLRTAGPEVAAVLENAVEELAESVRELRELARGLLPPGLADDGLVAALQGLTRRSRLPTRLEIDHGLGRLPGAVEAAAYFVVAEGLTNAAKHARPTEVQVRVRLVAGVAVVEVVDDGIGGAVLQPGGGLAGLAERVDIHGGRLRVDSPPDGGTSLVAELPCAS